MKQKIASIFIIVSLVFFHTAPAFAQLDTTTPPAETTPVEETVTPPADTTAPVISGVVAPSLGINDVTIIWSTDEAAASTLEYGTTASYGSSATVPATALLAHSATLTGLTANTTYHYCIHATDAAGNKSSSCSHTFTTEAETATEPIIADSDSDGVSDTEEIGTVTEPVTGTSTSTPESFPDTDSDGTPNYLDPDDDGDGIATETENTTSTTTPDTTVTEPDADADSVPDYLEPNTIDTDADGITNNLDPDDDGDTVPTINDGTITNDPVDPIDTDADGTPNYLDSNDDGDAIPTANEETATSTDPVATDTDGDTIPDYLESNTTDTDNDGVANVADPDDDGDTVPTADEVITDTSDTDAAVDEAIADTDNDGIPNALDPDDDGDGTPTAEEDTNHDGTVLDDDADGDGIPDFEEPNNVDTDQDGLTNNVDSDDDGDTVPTAQEVVSVPATVSSGGGGGGGYYYIPPIDTDSDGIPDYLDTNDDNDAIPTKNEKGDTDGDKIPNYKESNTRDLDKDGKKDVRDNEDDGDGILSKIDSDPYSESCYAPAELGYAVYVVSPNGTVFRTAISAKKTVIAGDIIRYDFELGTDNDFNDLSVRVNDEGHRAFVTTVMNSEVGARYVVHLQILGNGQVEKDLTLWTNPRLAVNVPQKIAVNQYLKICGDHENFCPAHITSYMRKGVNNDPVEVSKLQSFLVDQEGFTNVQVTGVFDNATDAAVRAFQEKHSGIVLGPWAIQKGTGYVYRTTTKRINDLYCAAK